MTGSAFVSSLKRVRGNRHISNWLWHFRDDRDVRDELFGLAPARARNGAIPKAPRCAHASCEIYPPYRP